MFLQKQYPEDFAFLTVRILELFTRKACLFISKSRPFFNVFYCFCMIVNKHWTHLKCPYIRKWKVFWCEIWGLLSFFMKTHRLQEFSISIIVSLMLDWVILSTSRSEMIIKNHAKFCQPFRDHNMQHATFSQFKVGFSFSTSHENPRQNL